MYFEFLMAPPEFEGVVCDQNPVFLCHDLEDVPIFRFAELLVVDMSGFVSSFVGDLR
ncbi:MAG: hypothetical protein QOH35_815 [Acidobacteriaceae bacterium]|jgi:hypothetical protein|nr:hypothetical protein [Acidobacteriaceae bacterium]MEA2539449.1 hypothetical protein [Acidobacteriaceae bacterium]